MACSGVPGDIGMDELEAGTRADQQLSRAKFKDFKSNIKLSISRIIEDIIGFLLTLQDKMKFIQICAIINWNQ
jgi:hypothetical protein